ncbi:MAG: PKD domain-containing protein [Bacteroidales bacterium]|nr:PKD domain-containing protein [Bacteroidales bacterium]
MKRFSTLFLAVALFMPGLLMSQAKVYDVSDLPQTPIIQRLGDADGKILIDPDFIHALKDHVVLNPVEVFPGWPIYESGSSQRGGIYCNLDNDPDLEMVYCAGQKVFAFNVEGDTVEGWPVTVQLFPDGAPAFGDIDGDGEGEVVVSTRSSGTANTGKLFAFHKDGAPVTGFPVILNGGATKTPVLADMDGDDVFEIILEERNHPAGYVGVYKGDGTPLPGWPQALDYIPGSAVAVGDLDGDGIPEIVAESYYSIYAFDAGGNILPGFPFTPGNDRVFSYSSPVLADLDQDGQREIIAGDHSLSQGNGQVHVLKSDGSLLPGWPKTTGNWIYGPPAVADIDDDGSPDIAIGDQVLSGTPANRVYVWNAQGTFLPGWPSPFIWAVNNQIIIADLDGDDSLELMWDDNTGSGIYLGYNHDGTVMDGWPLTVQGSTFFMNPFVTDINQDGILDISGGGNDMTAGCWYYLWNTGAGFHPEKAVLPVLQYNVQHNGVYSLPSSAPEAAFTADTTTVCQGGSLQFFDLSAGNILTWNWHFEGGQPEFSTGQNPLVTYEEPGFYNVELIVSDQNTSDTLVKEDYIEVVVCLGRKEFMPAEGISAVPNPCISTCMLAVNKEYRELHTTLLDRYGKILKKNSFGDLKPGAFLPLEMEDLPAGMYFLKVHSADEQMIIKLIKLD